MLQYVLYYVNLTSYVTWYLWAVLSKFQFQLCTSSAVIYSSFCSVFSIIPPFHIIYTPSVLPFLLHILTPSLNRLLIICLKSTPASHLLFPPRCCCGMTPHGLHLTFHPCSSGCADYESSTPKLLSSFFPRKLIANTIISSQKQLTSADWNIKTKKKTCTVLLKLDSAFIGHFRQ